MSPTPLPRDLPAEKAAASVSCCPFVPKVRMFSTFYFSEILSDIGEEIARKGLDLLLFKPAEW